MATRPTIIPKPTVEPSAVVCRDTKKPYYTVGTPKLPTYSCPRPNYSPIRITPN